MKTLTTILPPLFAAAISTAAYAADLIGFTPSDPSDSPLSNIDLTGSGNDYVYGVKSDYALEGGVGPITIKSAGDTAFGMFIGTWGGEAPSTTVGNIEADIDVTANAVAQGISFARTVMGDGRTISGNVVSRSRASYAYGMIIHQNAASDTGIIATVSGRVAAYSDVSYAYGVHLGGAMGITLDGGTIYAEGGDTAFGIYNLQGISAVNMKGNSRIEVKAGPDSAYAIIAPGNVTLNGDKNGLQTIIGDLYAATSSSSGRSRLAINEGNYFIDNHNDYTMVYSHDVEIAAGAKMEFAKTVVFHNEKGNTTAIDGDIVIHAESLSDYVGIIGDTATFTVGESATLTIVLGEAFTAVDGDTMSILGIQGSGGIVSSFNDENVRLEYSDGTEYDGEWYSYLNGGKTSWGIIFGAPIPEPSAFAGLAGVFALAWALCRRSFKK